MKKTVFISTALLPATLRARFLSLLEVAARRSIVAWEVVDGPGADVVLRERLGADDDRSVPIYISDTPLPHADVNLLRLERDFRVTALMDVLDLAAVRVMSRREQSARVTVALPAQSDVRYRLKHWVFLGGNRGGANYVRVLAAMTREPVSRPWIMKTGGLNDLQVDSLLSELQLRGALLSEVPSAAAPTRPRTATTAASRGFVSRLKRWIGGSRSAALAAPAAR
ncbi:hypothetical protein [Xenophilus sp. Marseille-Q4582]|uniref:hypothetical protein n=1 Tax=Xenophilus sp. Marseille-Q4582 TaxID=2866600 RepID=UPI001CE4B41C|nr:hypothetical protein [Xenophilus sp. Marseille-Q4582]